MKIKYKIMETWPEEHLIVVRYYTDFLGESDLGGIDKDGNYTRGRTDYSIQLPIPTPSEAEIIDLIKANAPKEWFEVKQKIADPEINTDLSGLVLNVESELDFT